MDNTTLTDLMRTGQSDQVLTALRDMSGRIATLYAGFVAGGIPRSTAAYLVIDYQRLVLYRAFWPNDPFIMGHPLIEE